MEKQARQDQEGIEKDIIEKARSLEIETYGKTREELLIAMFKKGMEREKTITERNEVKPPGSGPSKLNQMGPPRMSSRKQ